MFRKITITNYLFIKEAILEFSDGFNVLIGESGVGKSLLVNVLSIPLGQKPAADIIGKWGDKSVIDICVSVDDSEDIHIKIEIGKKVLFQYNNAIVSAKKIKEYFSSILDIHSQNNYDLLQQNQIGILNLFMNAKEGSVFNEYKNLYVEYRNLKEKFSFLESQILSKLDTEYYSYQLAEIEKINPVINEDVELFEQIQVLQNKMKWADKLELIKSSFENADSELFRGVNELTSISDDLEFKDLSDKAKSIRTELEDLNWMFVKKFNSDKDLASQNFESLEERLGLLEELKTRHKKSIAEIVEYKEEILERIDKQDVFKHELKKLQILIEEKEESLFKLAKNLTDIRKHVSDRVITSVKQYLVKLKLEKTEIVSSFKERKNLDEFGLDNFEFLIRVNVGSSFKSIDSLSGGETSRVLLALKAVLSEASTIQSYVFDEIDSGVSGDIAVKMGKVLKQISEKRQLIVITHLPMIAVKGENVFKIEKGFEKDSTLINVKKMETEEEILGNLSELVSSNPTAESKAYIRSLMQ